MLPYKSSGEENLRANASVKSADPNSSPSGAGKDMGGTDNLRANHKVMANAGKSLPSGGAAGSRPAGVQTFDEMGF